MSLTIQQILTDAKKLTSKLKEDDSAADTLLSQTQAVHKQIDAMKHYADDLAELNESARQGPHGDVIMGIQQENRLLRDLQIENRELKLALQDYQNAVELIMSKYRTHIAQLMDSSKIDYKHVFHDNQNKKIEEQAEKINEMRAVMSHAANLMDSEVETDRTVHMLEVENEGLREMLKISKRFGSLNILDQTNENQNSTASKLAATTVPTDGSKTIKKAT